MTRILVVEDDPSIRLGLEDTLTAKGYEVDVVGRGGEGAERAQTGRYDLVVLDVMLPDIDGFEVCRRIRAGKASRALPVIMLSARGAELDRVRGLELGADDYVTKPFSLMELLARVASVLRRARGDAAEPNGLRLGDIDIDLVGQVATRGGVRFELPSRAFAILKVFARRPGEVVTREVLLDEAWGYEDYPNTRTVDNHLVKLRKALEAEPDKPRWLVTVHGAGYKLDVARDAVRWAGIDRAGRPVSDKIVTTFCTGVTPCREPETRRRSWLDTKELGEAMASVLENLPSGGQLSGTGVTPVFVALLLALCACGDDAAPPPLPARAPAAAKSAADPATGITTDLDGTAPAFGDAVIAELTGDPDAARAAFERVLDATDTPPALAARAALHLAQLDARTGKSRHALDLVARASALAPSDKAVIDGASQVEADLVAASGAGDIRGPRLGTPLPGVEPRVVAEFAAAERALERVHEMRPRAVIEALSSSLRDKEDATEDVVAKYRAVALHGGLAQVAADYRAGSLYHDLALGLLFELPPELDPAFAAGLRRTLRVRAVAYLHRAVASYRACLAGVATPDAELWRAAADTDLRGASDVLASAP